MALCLVLAEVFAQSSSVDSIGDKELLDVLIEDTAGELARNQASLDQTRAIYRGLDDSNANERAFRLRVEEYIRYYDDLIASQTDYLSELRERRIVLEEQELQKLRNLSNFGSPYRDRKRAAMLESILRPRSSEARFGISGKTRLEDLDNQLYETLGSLQERLDEESQNRQEAKRIMLDREADVKTIVAMQEVSQTYYDERFLLYDKMNQTYEMMFLWRPDLAQFFRPPPRPKPPDVYQRTLDRMQAEKQ